MRQEGPFYTCDAVLAELGFVINDPIPGLKLVARGDLILDFDLCAQLDRVLELLDKYRDRRMELADACLVRMSELTDACKIWTVDRADFRVYRRHGRAVIPCEFPKPEIGTGPVRVVGDLGKSRNWESRKQKGDCGRKS